MSPATVEQYKSCPNVDTECVRRVMRSFRDDTNLQKNLKDILIRGIAGYGEGADAKKEQLKKIDHRAIWYAFTDPIMSGGGDVLVSVSNLLKTTPNNLISNLESAQIRGAFDWLCARIKAECDERKNFKDWFGAPNNMERGIGVIIFIIIYLYGWLAQGTSAAFAESMQTAKKSNAEMSMFDLLMANYVQMGTVQILWAMIVALTKSWVLMVAMLAIFYFVESFIVEAALNPINVVRSTMGECAKYYGVPLVPIIPIAETLKKPMKSIRVALFFVTDAKVLYAILYAILMSVLFACCTSLYLGAANASPEDAKFAGKMVCVFQLIVVFSFVAFAMFGPQMA